MSDIVSSGDACLAPTEIDWYHGRLDRNDADERLRRSCLSNCYLVRESDRKPGSYVLSFLGKTGVNHFRITAVYGDFYIGGRQFDSLQDLIGCYYSFKSDLLKSERLQNPVPPPEPVNDRRRVIAILPYTKMPDSDELSFDKGDIFFVHNEVSDGWLWATSHRTGVQGLIFRDLMTDLDDDPNIDPNSVFPWFHKHISKDSAVELLVASGPGSYLVRPSDNSPGDYSLFFHVANQIQRFRIEKKGSGMRYTMGGRSFNCLQAVVDRYKAEPIFDGHTLSHYVKKAASDDASLPVRQESPEKSAADRIYATLRECREQAEPKHQRGVKMQGYMAKCKTKAPSLNLGSLSLSASKWKQLFFVLKQDETDNHLYFYDNPKRTKPKGLIDLSCCCLYEVDNSVHNRRNSFLLVERALPCLSTTSVLSCDDLSEYRDWIDTIKPMCLHQTGSDALGHVSYLRQARSLTLTVSEASRLHLISNVSTKSLQAYYCTLAYVVAGTAHQGGPIVAKTGLSRPGSQAVFDEKFQFDNVPPDVSSVVVTLVSRPIGHNGQQEATAGRDVELATHTVPLASSLDSQSPGTFRSDQWYPLVQSMKMASGVDGGSLVSTHSQQGSSADHGQISSLPAIRIGVIYTNDLVMPEQEYASLKVLLLDTSYDVVRAIGRACQTDRQVVANALLRIYRFDKLEADLLTVMNSEEISAETDHSTLFRGSSLASSLMHAYMQSVCGDFLSSALETALKRVTESTGRTTCELNPTAVSSAAEANANADFLLSVLEDLTESIFMSSEACPRTLRYIFYCLQRDVSEKWPNDRALRTRVVSSFIFLRLLCPTIVSQATTVGLVDSAQPSLRRSLVMVAKCLQSLANLVEFNGATKKEPYMEVVNPFIVKNKERMVVFVDHLSSIRKKPYPDEEQVRGDVANDLASVHLQCKTHLDELQDMAKDEMPVKTLVTVIDMLTKHKEKYVTRLTNAGIAATSGNHSADNSLPELGQRVGSSYCSTSNSGLMPIPSGTSRSSRTNNACSSIFAR